MTDNSYKIVHVDDTALFDSVVEENKEVAERGKLFVLCTGAATAEGVSWCGDCRAAEPHIRKTLEECAEQHETVLIEARIPREGYRGNPQHPYRLHPMLSLKGVPTLYLWSARGRPTRSLTEESCADPELLEEMWQ